MSQPDRSSTINLGVVVAAEPSDHPWQDLRWRPVDLLIGSPDLAIGDIVAEVEGAKHFFAGSFPLELFRTDTSAYLVNLENEPPSIYVILSEAEDEEPPLPYVVELVTASPFEAQDFLDTGEEIVEPIPMSEPLIAWVERFVGVHHEEEVFIKRRRDRVDIREEKFGQEPLAVVRQRQRRQ